MKNSITAAAILCLLWCAPAFGESNRSARPSTAVHALVIEGLQKTRRSVVVRELQFDVGDTPTASDLADAEERLLETGLFSRVDVDREAAVVRVIVEERWTLLPVVSLVNSGGVTRGTLGLIERNFIGLGWVLGGFVERFGGELGGEGWFEFDGLVEGFGLSGRGGWTFRPRVDLSGDGERFVHRRAGGRLLANRRLGDALVVHLGAFARRDRVAEREFSNVDVGPRFSMVVGELGQRAGHADGLDIELVGGFALESMGASESWSRVVARVRAAAPLPLDSSLFSELSVGTTTSDSAEERFYLGGRRLRGFRDSRFAGTTAALARVELRTSWWSSGAVIVQTSAFVDVGSVDELASVAGAAAGGGLRLVLPWAAHAAVYVEGAGAFVGRGRAPFAAGIEMTLDSGDALDFGIE